MLVEAHHAVLLSADGYGVHVVESTRSRDGLLQCIPPRVWVDLGAARMRVDAERTTAPLSASQMTTLQD